METRTYEITGKSSQLDILEHVFGIIEALGSVGSSRTISIYVDGDGAAILQFRREGERLSAEDISQDGDGFVKTDSSGYVKADLG